MNKPIVKIIGKDGNVFNLIGIVEKTLKKAGLKEQAKEFTEKAFNAGDYDEVLTLIGEYCTVR